MDPLNVPIGERDNVRKYESGILNFYDPPAGIMSTLKE
jgi:hypothetical protein